MMFDYATQEEADHVMIGGVVRMLFPVLKRNPEPWTFFFFFLKKKGDIDSFKWIINHDTKHPWPVGENPPSSTNPHLV